MATVIAKYGKCNNDEIYVGNINTLVEVGIIKSIICVIKKHLGKIFGCFCFTK